MAILHIMAVHDRQLDAYMRPFVAQTIGQAIREFRDEVNKPNTQLNTHPEDYELHKLGNFDEATGQVYGLKEGPEQVAIATNLLEKQR